MSPRMRALLAQEVPSRRRAAIIGLVFLAGAVAFLAVGTVLPAVFLGAGVALILVAYLATYGPTWTSRPSGRGPHPANEGHGDEDRTGGETGP